MAGSLNHLISSNGKFTISNIDKMGDAVEALQECFDIIMLLAEGDFRRVRRACVALNYPVPIPHIEPWLEPRVMKALHGVPIKPGEFD